jgi:D-alanine transfer protein
MANGDPMADKVHLSAGAIAVGLAAIVLLGLEMSAERVELATVRASAPELFSLKNQGLAFQRAAARSPAVLPLYGSSELTAVLAPERAYIFFRAAPTGFQVSPVGAGGADPLIILQKVAALGSDLRGKKIAISLSPGWFLHPGPAWLRGYEGNFSSMAASEMAFGTALNFKLKRDIAARMLKCPGTLEKNPLLELALKRLASGGWLDCVIFCALWPLGKLQTTLLELQDHWAASSYIRRKLGPGPSVHLQTPDWPKLIATFNRTQTTDQATLPTASRLARHKNAQGGDSAFRKRMYASPGWIDLELLLRTLARVHASPLLFSMPIAGDFFDREGVTRAAREDYYAKLRTVVQKYHFPLVEFKGHDEDPAFLYRHQSHLTAKGWIYYDRALDNFFHGRTPHT